MKLDYNTEAIKLSKAIDIAIDAFTKFPPKSITTDNLAHVISLHHQWKTSILKPEPKFRKIVSLKYHIEDVFTYFQEGSGETVEYFWRQIAGGQLGYGREDKLRKILDRGKIKGRIEFELAIDSIVPAEQDKRITQDEARQLGEMIGEFERSGRKKS